MKERVHGAPWLAQTNLAGDRQADQVRHGGPDKAVCVYPAAHYPHWRRALHHQFAFGSFGENFTVSEADETSACIGDILAIGTATVEISQPRQPCWKLACRWQVKELPLLVQESGRTGWYLRVLAEGEVREGDNLLLLERPFPHWTIAAANQALHARPPDLSARAALARCPKLSASWRRSLQKTKNEQESDATARLYGHRLDAKARQG